MMRTRALWLSLLALSLSACSAVLKFDECTVDVDCASRQSSADRPLFCTNDHLCVDHVPTERLCVRKAGAVGNANAIVIGALARIGSEIPLELDLAMVNAVELAVEQISQVTPIVAVICDSGSTLEQAARAVEQVVQVHHAIGIVGPTTSGLTIPVTPTAVKNDVLLVSPSATSPAITNLDDSGLVWRTGVSDVLQARILAETVEPTTDVLDTFYANGPYGQGINDEFVRAWGERTALLGTMRVPMNTFSFEEGSIPSDKIMRMAMDMPKEALLVADPDAPALVQAIANAGPGLSQTRFLMTDAAKGTTLFGADPAAIVDTLARVRGTGPARPSESGDPSTPIFNTFRGGYVDRFGADPGNTAFVANAYDAAYVIAIVASAAMPSKRSGTALLDGMGRISKASPTTEERISVGPTQFLKAVSALSAGGEIDLVGASGPIDFDAQTGDVRTGPIELWGIDVTIPSAPAFVTILQRTP